MRRGKKRGDEERKERREESLDVYERRREVLLSDRCVCSHVVSLV